MRKIGENRSGAKTDTKEQEKKLKKKTRGNRLEERWGASQTSFHPLNTIKNNTKSHLMTSYTKVRGLWSKAEAMKL